MVSVLIRDKYIETLGTLGDLRAVVDLALDRYTIEEITVKVSTLKKCQTSYEEKYRISFAEMNERVKYDERFVRTVEQEIGPTWEADLLEWEFCVNGIQDWTERLQALIEPGARSNSQSST